MYGISQGKKELGLKIIKKTKTFLNNNYFQIGNDSIPMAVLVKNAYHNSDKYIAEVNHRIYSLNNYANEKGLVPIFGTITLPSEYHTHTTLPNGKVIKNRKFGNMHLIPKDERIYSVKTKKQVLPFSEYLKYTPNAGAKQLSKMFKSLMDTRQYKAIAKEDKCFFRVYEPHKDGTPHLHFSMFVPKDNIDSLVTAFKDYFSNNYPTLRTDFQTDIKNPVAYLMKYILKTFDDLREDTNNISNLSLWYIVNKITRFHTSRTLVSLEVYRKLNGRYNLLELTEMYKNKEVSVLLDIDTNKVVSIYNQYGSIYEKKTTTLNKIDKTINLNYKNKKDPFIVIDGVRYKQTYKSNQLEAVTSHPIIDIDGKDYKQINDELIEYNLTVPVNQMHNLQLHSHYREMNEDISSYNPHHYALVKNELINRDMIEDQIIPLNEFTEDYIVNEYGF